MDRVRRRLWVVLAALSALFGLFGLGDLLIGISFNEGVAPAVTGLTLGEISATSPDAYRLIDLDARGGGVTLVALGAALTAIVLFAYRDGRRWAWWAVWILPAWALGVLVLYLVYGLAPGQPPPPSLMSAPIIAAVTAAALLIDAPRFRAERGAERAEGMVEA
jgi:hypothetical protein